MSLALIDTNDVHLIGRLAELAVYKTMPSGDAAVTFRLVIRRAPAAVRRQTTDSIECIGYRAATIKAAVGWMPGDVLDLRGALRRRFWRGEAGVRSAYDVEVATIRRVSRAAATSAISGAGKGSRVRRRSSA